MIGSFGDASSLKGSSVLLASVGNTRTRYAWARDGELHPAQAVTNASDRGDILVQALRDEAGSRDDRPTRLLLASVNDPHAELIENAVRAAALRGVSTVRFGRDVPIPISDSLADRTTVGQDRLLSALGAYSRNRQACVVIDAGTAVTVDFVDGAGTFHGGAIAPGLAMMGAALHEKTTALPAVCVSQAHVAVIDDRGPQRTPFGRDTESAIALGLVIAIRGLAHSLIDRFAEYYGGYPSVLATGGDAPLLFENDDLVERIVPDLTLIGMLAAVEMLIAGEK